MDSELIHIIALKDNKIYDLQKENDRLQKFIEKLHVVHFTELQREKAMVEAFEKEFDFEHDCQLRNAEGGSQWQKVHWQGLIM